MAYCKINKENYFYNLSKVEQKIGIDKIAVVVKNNAYGHGINEISKLANEYGIKHSITISVNEAVKISHLFESVLVLQDIPKGQVSDNIIITINSIETICKLSPNTKVELEIDTGMNRNGISINQINEALNQIIEYDLKLNGVFTHFSSAYIDDNSIDMQKNKFDYIRSKIIDDNRFSEKVRFHCSASSALYRFDNNVYDLVRVGIISYGYLSLPSNHKLPKLKPVLSLWAEKVTSRMIDKSESVGYGRMYTADKKMEISTYDIGYGDGFMRLDGNKNIFLKNGRRILGITSMNSFTAEGNDDEVCVFDDITELANTHGTIVYELLSRINPNLNRKVI